MTSSRVTALLSGLGLLATWVASVPPGAQAPVPVRLPAASGASRADAPLPVIQVNTDRLRVDADRRDGFIHPRRNPFEFSARAIPLAVPTHPIPAAASAEALPPVPPPPPFTLAGIAEDLGVRTAVLSSQRDVFLVREGDVVDGRYTVGKIGADGVELMPVGDGSSVFIRLK